MGRNRYAEIPEGDQVTINVLLWCGQYLTPFGLGAETLANKEYQEIRAMKRLLQDDSIPGEQDCPRNANAIAYQDRI